MGHIAGEDHVRGVVDKAPSRVSGHHRAGHGGGLALGPAADQLERMTCAQIAATEVLDLGRLRAHRRIGVAEETPIGEPGRLVGAAEPTKAGIGDLGGIGAENHHMAALERRIACREHLNAAGQVGDMDVEIRLRRQMVADKRGGERDRRAVDRRDGRGLAALGIEPVGAREDDLVAHRPARRSVGEGDRALAGERLNLEHRSPRLLGALDHGLAHQDQPAPDQRRIGRRVERPVARDHDRRGAAGLDRRLRGADLEPARLGRDQRVDGQPGGAVRCEAQRPIDPDGRERRRDDGIDSDRDPVGHQHMRAWFGHDPAHPCLGVRPVAILSGDMGRCGQRHQSQSAVARCRDRLRAVHGWSPRWASVAQFETTPGRQTTPARRPARSRGSPSTHPAKVQRPPASSNQRPRAEARAHGPRC